MPIILAQATKCQITSSWKKQINPTSKPIIKSQYKFGHYRQSPFVITVHQAAMIMKEQPKEEEEKKRLSQSDKYFQKFPGRKTSPARSGHVL